MTFYHVLGFSGNPATNQLFIGSVLIASLSHTHTSLGSCVCVSPRDSYDRVEQRFVFPLFHSSSLFCSSAFVIPQRVSHRVRFMLKCFVMTVFWCCFMWMAVPFKSNKWREKTMLLQRGCWCTANTSTLIKASLIWLDEIIIDVIVCGLQPSECRYLSTGLP